MTSLKHTLLLAFASLQLLGALALLASFFVAAWHLELLLSFTPLLMGLLLAGLVSTTVCIVLLKNYKQNALLVGTTCATWLVAVCIAAYAFTAQTPIVMSAPEGKTITFAALNKLYSNHDTDRFTTYLDKQDIDILALQEMRPSEVPGVAERLGFEHTYTSRTFATSGGTSVALLSRFPFASVETIELATEHPVIRAEVETPGSGTIVVYSVHIPVPASKFLYNKRNVVFQSLAETIQNEKLPVIVGGDFNTTIFSPAMRLFSREVAATIKPIAAERIPACSWYGYGPLMCVRIDHVFAPKDAEIASLVVSSDIGPDHRALIAKIRLARLAP